jgi:hypothetical protein
LSPRWSISSSHRKFPLLKYGEEVSGSFRKFQ